MGAVAIDKDEKVIFTNFAPFAVCIREINNTQIGNAKGID